MPTYAGINRAVVLERYPHQVRAAIRRLADHFYVTRDFDSVSVGNSTYHAVLVRPTDDMSIFLNTDQELIVLFSLYETFELRTLDAYDKFFSIIKDRRIDKTIRFLISADENIDNSIRHYLNQHPEYPVIVPTTFIQMQRRTNPLLVSVQRNYIIRDLFGFQSPLTEDYFFFGRDEVVGHVIDMGRTGQSCSLFGLRKSGKTSTILAIKRRSRAAELNVVIVDCQDLAVHGREYGDLLIYLIHKIRAACNLKAVSNDLHMTGVEIAEWFRRNMESILGSVKSNIILIFDEIENISPNTATSPHWRTGLDPVYFWQVIRSFCQFPRLKRQLSICIVGTSPYLLEEAKINELDNPVYLFAPKRFIPNLSFDETREMVSRLGFFMGLNFSPQAVAKLHASYGGHPFFTRQVCSKVHRIVSMNRPTEVSLSCIEEAQREFRSELESYVREIILNLKTFYPEEFRLLRSMIIGDGSELTEYLVEAPELVDHLLGYGLVVVRGGEYEIAFDAVRGAVLKLEPELPEEPKNTEDRWAEISARRNAIEQAIRANLFIASKSISNEDWQIIVKRAMSEQRLLALESREPSYLFSRKSSPLYLSDLLGILKDVRVLPHLEARRRDIVGAIDTLNRARRDAHANDVDDATWLNARAALDELEREFAIP